MHKYYNLESKEENLSSEFPTITNPVNLPKEYKRLLIEHVNSIPEFPENIEMLPDLIIGENINLDMLEKELKKYKEVKGDFFDDYSHKDTSDSYIQKDTFDSYIQKDTKNAEISGNNFNENFTTGNGKKIKNDANHKLKTQGSHKSVTYKSSDCDIDDIVKQHPEYAQIASNIVTDKPNIKLDDIAGLANIKNILKEVIVWPIQNPEYFTGLRNPPNGLLLFGPPGTGKTLLGKSIASEINATFFTISASSILSKFIGENEKAIKNLFELSNLISQAKNETVVIFIDEIDSLLQSRSDSEHESSRRLKTEFLVQLDGINKTKRSNKVLIIGATNRPQEIDDAARRRFVKRLYVPLPCKDSRKFLINKLLNEIENDLENSQKESIAIKTEKYSGSDLYNLVREAVMAPVRELMRNKNNKNMRKVNYNDFIEATKQIKSSVDEKELESYEKWNQKYGSV